MSFLDAGGNVKIRKMLFEKAGAVHPGHKHPFDHVSIVFSGSVVVKATGLSGQKIEQEFHAPAHFLVLAQIEHQIIALEAGTEVWCVYARRNGKGEVVEYSTGWDTDLG